MRVGDEPQVESVEHQLEPQRSRRLQRHAFCGAFAFCALCVLLAPSVAWAQGPGEALSGRGGMEAMQLRVAEEYVKQFGKLANEASSTLVVPATLSDISSMIAMATSVIKQQNKSA